MKKVIKAVCEECHGTGLYRGMCERPGYPVVCVRCDGTGCMEIHYTPFSKRRLLKGVKGVSMSRGRSILLGCGPCGDEMTYKQFLAAHKQKQHSNNKLAAKLDGPWKITERYNSDFLLTRVRPIKKRNKRLEG